MKMNDTVARIVEIMFQDIEMNEEVRALREEVMNNCQERYNDLVNSGIPADDAVAAVVESLKGMEDVLAQYHKHSVPHADAYVPQNDPEMMGECDMTWHAGEVAKIDLTLISEDVSVEISDDNMYHVVWDADEDPQIRAALQGSVLKIDRDPNAFQKERKHQKVTIDAGDGRPGHIHMDGDSGSRDMELNLENIGAMLGELGRSLGRMFSSLRNSMGGGDGVTIQIPDRAVPAVKLLTTSGDIDVEGVCMESLSAISTSGDITVTLDEDEHISSANLRTTSGDVEATIFADEVNAGSTSGDVDVEGRITNLTVNTVSGDIDVRADVQKVSFKAISGDVDLTFDSDEIREVNGSTVSGDIDVDLPAGIGFISINTHTRSGDVTTCHHSDGVGPAVTGSLTSLSGDITIR